MNVVDQFYDIIDECCMRLNEKLHLNYFDCLIRVANDILYDINVSKLEEEDLKFLEEKYDQLSNVKITNEEVRLTMQLLIIKAMKHVNMNLEIMTPDYINYIIGYLINSYYKGVNSEISVLDVEVGTGNLINAIANYSDLNIDLIGIDNNKNLINLCKANTELQNNDIDLYFQDTLTTFLDEVDVIVGDLDCVTVNDKYYPYEIILNYLPNLSNDGLFIYLIENDFFAKEQINDFKKEFQGTFLGLIVLPQNLFNEKHIGKSLLVGTSRKLTSFEMMIIQLSDLNNKEKFYNDLEEIQNWIKKIKEI